MTSLYSSLMKNLSLSLAILLMSSGQLLKAQACSTASTWFSHGISTGEPVLSTTIVLRLTVQERVLIEREAEARGYGVTGIARMLIERMVQDDLIRAVLDD